MHSYNVHVPIRCDNNRCYVLISPCSWRALESSSDKARQSLIQELEMGQKSSLVMILSCSSLSQKGFKGKRIFSNKEQKHSKTLKQTAFT